VILVVLAVLGVVLLVWVGLRDLRR